MESNKKTKKYLLIDILIIALVSIILITVILIYT
jgi:hypothetical protein